MPDAGGDAGPEPVRPPSGRVRVSVAQVSVSDDHLANRHVVADVFRQVARVRPDLIVFPEYMSAYDRRGVSSAHAEPLDGPFVTDLRRLAREHGTAVIAGTTLPGSQGRAVNTVVAVDAAGELAGTYRKVHLYDAFGTRESDLLEAGPADAPPLVLPVGELAVGVLTCYDLRFPESARRAVDAGADVLVYPAAWVAGPLKADQWRTLLQARAIENTAIVLGVGMAGKGVTGRSALVGPDGVVALELGETPDVRTVDLDPAGIAAVRAANPSLANRRYAVVPRYNLPR